MNRQFCIKCCVYTALYALTIGIVASTFLLSPHSRNDFPLIRAFIIVFASILLTKYFLYMILAPWSDVAVALQHRRFGARPYTPLVSVIILAWNEEVGIVQTVRTILQSTYRNVEVIVVNDGSTDNSDRIMREFVAKHERVSAHAGGQKINLKYFYKENGGKGRALNYGLAQAQGDIVISIDADCALTPETIGNFVTCFRDPKVMAAVGNVKIGSTRSLIGTVQHLEFLFSFYFKKAESLLNTIYIIGGAAGAFRREVLERLNGYDSSNITEDIELSVRIQKAGMKIVYASEAIVYTEGASTITGLMKQRLRWKRGRFQTFRQHRDLFFSLSRSHNKWLTCLMLPFAFFGDIQLFFELYFVLFLYVYSFLTNDFSSFISGIVVVSTIFVVQIFFEEGAERSWSLYLLAPIGWLLFYITTVVEYNTLIKSLWGSVTHQAVTWQRWERKGCLDEFVST